MLTMHRIHIHTMFLTGFVVFIPAYEVVRLCHTSRKVAYSNDKWETVSQAITIQIALPAKGSTIELVEKDQIFRYMSGSYGNRLLTMTALNRVLQEHPTPLQEFSAYSDFSGENVAFLTSLAKWRATWSTQSSELDQQQRINTFNAALDIYIDFISPRDAEFPLNLSFAQLQALETVFEHSARVVCGESRIDPAAPFAFELPPSRRSDGSEAALHARYTGDISELFGPNVFDEVETHIKDLVLTNTWPKFVREMQLRRRRSVDSERSGMSDGSDGSDVTVVSRVSRFIKGLV
jgi:hypothetical protein